MYKKQILRGSDAGFGLAGGSSFGGQGTRGVPFQKQAEADTSATGGAKDYSVLQLHQRYAGVQLQSPTKSSAGRTTRYHLPAESPSRAIAAAPRCDLLRSQYRCSPLCYQAPAPLCSANSMLFKDANQVRLACRRECKGNTGAGSPAGGFGQPTGGLFGQPQASAPFGQPSAPAFGAAVDASIWPSVHPLALRRHLLRQPKEAALASAPHPPLARPQLRPLEPRPPRRLAR